MIRAREIRNALLGAILLIGVGTLQGCAADSMVAPEEDIPVQATAAEGGAEGDADGEPVCKMKNGMMICL